MKEIDDLMATTESRSRPTSTTSNPGSRSHSALSPSPVRQQSSLQRRPTVGSVSVFAAKNKLRKTHPLASTNTLNDDPVLIKSTLESESSSSAVSTPPDRQSPVNNARANSPPNPPTLVDEAQRISRRASPGFVIARPNSSLSLLKPHATKAQKVRGLRGANRAIKMKIIRAFSRLFSVKGGKTSGGQSNGRIEAPMTQKEPKFVRLFIPRRFLLRNNKNLDGKGKEREDVSNVDGRKDSKLALDSPKVTFTETRPHSSSPTESIVLQQAHGGESSPKQKGILRVRLKKEDQQNGNAKEPNGTISPSGKPSLPPGVLVVEDPVWSARKKNLNNYNRDPYTPPRTPTLDTTKESADSPSPRAAVKGKSRDTSPYSKSLIAAYGSGKGQDQETLTRKGRKLEAGEYLSKEKQKEQTQLLQVPISATPPPQVRTPPNEIGLALTTDDVSIMSEISRASSVAIGQLTPNYLQGFDDEEGKRLSWMIPNNLNAEDLGRPTHRSSLLQETPSASNKLWQENPQNRFSSSRTSTSTIVTPTRIVTSPTSQLRRSPNADFDELVEFNVLVRPGDALYDILVEQEQQLAAGDGEDFEIESEIEYYTADEDESAGVSGDEDDRDSVASGTGTIRAVEISSEGGTMRGVEIVGKKMREKRQSGVGSADNWGFADVLVGSRR